MRAWMFAAGCMLACLASRGNAADLRHFDDANLHAVQFIDAKEGWAVGDDGVVWHTLDGGASWERQPTGVRASLRSLHFLTPFVGWVVGREELPYGGGSVGVMLFTKNGGLTWQRPLSNSLPGLNVVRFTDTHTGYVAGDANDPFASGLFKTADGGRSWEPVPIQGPRVGSWLAADFYDGQSGLLAGAWSSLALMRQGRLGMVKDESLGGRHIHALQILKKRALAVGEGGLVLTSVSGGESWGFAELNLPREVAANLDFHGLHALGAHAWVVGRPGSIVLTTDDSGASWKMHRTGHPLPLYGVYFLDSNKGWAVGALGAILTTSDGGQTWTVQRQGGKRAAVLGIHARAAEIPVDTVAHLGGADGYLVAAMSVAAPDPASARASQASDSLRLASALRLAGGVHGSLLWQFPVPQYLARASKQQLLDHWNKLHGNQAERELLRQLVLALRVWRPSAVVTDHPDPQATGSAADALVAEAVNAAFLQAADPKAFPEQIEQLGLEPWTSTRLLAAWGGKDPHVTLDNDVASVRLQSSIRDFAALAHALLNQETRALPPQRHYRILQDRSAAGTPRFILDGIALAPNSEARRAVAFVEKDDKILKAITLRKNLALLAANMKDPSVTLAQMGPALAQLPDEQAAAAAFGIASDYAQRGQWNLAREAYLLLADRYASHPLALEACRWLVRHNSSSEARRRHELGQFLMLSRTGVVQQPFDFKGLPQGQDGVQKTNLTEMITQGQVANLANDAQARHWYKGSLDLGKKITGQGPLFASDPALQFCLQASRRHLGDVETALDWYGKCAKFYPPGPWQEAAAAELWLAKRGLTSPKRSASCKFIDARPLLDGAFEDPCWQNRHTLTLANAVGDTAHEYPTQAWFAYDQKYLYIALRCRHPQAQPTTPVKPRPRDPDLEPYDRVSIMLDLDRDYATYYHLQVDQRGCVREDCWGDLAWNPRWFVAVHSTADSWNIEAAIPLTELTGDRILSAAWACNVVRTIPGRGVQAWSLPADAQPRPEGMGLLLFQNQPNQPVPKTPIMPKATP